MSLAFYRALEASRSSWAFKEEGMALKTTAANAALIPPTRARGTIMPITPAQVNMGTSKGQKFLFNPFLKIVFNVVFIFQITIYLIHKPSLSF
jgi:hypothetical protein